MGCRRQDRAAGRDRAVLIARDTRFSGESLAGAVAAGLAAEGWRAASLGILPTPALARSVRSSGAALGIVITASHNPAADNGIKIFGPDGRKLTDQQEAEIERLLPAEDSGGEGRPARPPAATSGLASRSDAAADYIAAAAALLPAGSLGGWRIVLDTAHGATCATSPVVFRALGAEVIGLGDSPDGRNINAGVGSEHPELMASQVRASAARLGAAHDGDGDRCVLCDERGEDPRRRRTDGDPRDPRPGARGAGRPDAGRHGAEQFRTRCGGRDGGREGRADAGGRPVRGRADGPSRARRSEASPRAISFFRISARRATAWSRRSR